MRGPQKALEAIVREVGSQATELALRTLPVALQLPVQLAIRAVERVLDLGRGLLPVSASGTSPSPGEDAGTVAAQPYGFGPVSGKTCWYEPQPGLARFVGDPLHHRGLDFASGNVLGRSPAGMRRHRTSEQPARCSPLLHWRSESWAAQQTVASAERAAEGDPGGAARDLDRPCERGHPAEVETQGALSLSRAAPPLATLRRHHGRGRGVKSGEAGERSERTLDASDSSVGTILGRGGRRVRLDRAGLERERKMRQE
jgi:hypothetical protein